MANASAKAPVNEFGCIDCGGVSVVTEVIGWLWFLVPLAILILQPLLVGVALRHIRNGALNVILVILIVFAPPALCWLIALNVSGGGILAFYAIIVTIGSVLGGWIAYIRHIVAGVKTAQ